MSQRRQENQWEPLGNYRRGNLTAAERLDIERGKAWSAYINLGMGEPRHFDFPTWSKMNSRRDGDEDRKRRSPSR